MKRERQIDQAWREHERQGVKHLRRSVPLFRETIRKVGSLDLQLRPADYHQLCKAVVGQQLSILAAASINQRFTLAVSRNARKRCRPQDILEKAPEELREVGLSFAKIRTVQGLAEFWLEHKLSSQRLIRMPDEELIELLTQVKGIGPWTVKMFLMFSLGRPNVLPFEDLGLRAGIKKIYELDEMPKIKEAEEIGNEWMPYASIATHYCWRILQVD